MILRVFAVVTCLYLSFSSFSQTKATAQKDSVNAATAFLKAWEKDFLDVGVSLQKDSFHINDEVKRLLVDSQYRKTTYPDKYEWPIAIQLMNSMELKKAFWHMIKLYQADTARKELVLQTFVLYDSLVDMEKILTNSFYTYALTDPQVCVIKNGKPNIQRPDILEKNFATVKEIIQTVIFNRKPSDKKAG